MKIINTIINRIYSDYLMPSRLNEYEELIQKSLDLGYIHITIRDYCRKLKENSLGEGKYFLHRHDIDTDASTAGRFFEIEKKYGIKASYYFRLSTLDIDLMKRIDNYGSEVGYHFEEIASYCKKNHIKTKQNALEKISDIRQLFINNFERIEKESGIKIHTVASHGDFANRKLALINKEITKSIKLRKYLSISCETYDDKLQRSFDIYISDIAYPVYYSPINVFDAIGMYNRICLTTHPREWKTNWILNTKDNINRFYEGLRW